MAGGKTDWRNEANFRQPVRGYSLEKLVNAGTYGYFLGGLPWGLLKCIQIAELRFYFFAPSLNLTARIIS